MHLPEYDAEIYKMWKLFSFYTLAVISQAEWVGHPEWKKYMIRDCNLCLL